MTPHDRREAEGRRERQRQAPAPPAAARRTAPNATVTERATADGAPRSTQKRIRRVRQSVEGISQGSVRGGRSRGVRCRGGEAAGRRRPRQRRCRRPIASGSRPATGRQARGRTSSRSQLRGRSQRSARARGSATRRRGGAERQCHVRRLVRVDHGRPEQRDPVDAPVAHREHPQASTNRHASTDPRRHPVRLLGRQRRQRNGREAPRQSARSRSSYR